MERFIEESKEKVLEKLSLIADLPNEGVLAGGAVANTILSLLDKREYPINDIDIFIEIFCFLKPISLEMGYRKHGVSRKSPFSV